MDSEKLHESWAAVTAQVKSYPQCNASEVDAFFSRLEPQAMSEGFLMLTVASDFLKTWIEQNYVETIRTALADLYHVPFSVVIAVNPDQDTRSSDSASGVSSHTPGAFSTPSFQNGIATDNAMSPNAETPSPERSETDPWQEIAAADRPPIPPSPTAAYADTSKERSSQSTALSSDSSQSTSGSVANESGLTFENYVIGDSNRMAYSMAVEVAESPGKAPLNPLFIYGKSGLGKTHLMRAVQNYVIKTQPQLKTVYVDSSELLNEYTEASLAHDREKSSFKNFKAPYEEADVLLIDDIQSLQGRPKTLDIVFQLFNKLTSQGKQVVLSADRAPKNIDIDERYTSRFSQGGTVDIQPPEIETKLGIVKSCIKQYAASDGFDHFTVPEDIQIYIAENSSSNVRELISAVTKVIYQMTYFDNPNLTVEDVRQLLENHFSGGASRNLTVEDIQGVVEEYYRVKRAELVGLKRERRIAYPRHICIYLCRQLLELPFDSIAKKFNRNHSTAMHSVRKIEQGMKDDRNVQEEIEVLTKIIRDL